MARQFRNQQSNAMTVVSEYHRDVTAGEVFNTGTVQKEIAKASTYGILFVTPADFQVNISGFNAQFSSGDVLLTVSEGATTSSDGTIEHPSVNRNRNSLVTAGAIFYLEPTVTAAGTTISKIWTPPTVDGTGVQTGRQMGSGEDSWLLKPDTKYLFLFENLSKNTIRFSVRLSWAELTEE